MLGLDGKRTDMVMKAADVPCGELGFSEGN